MKIALVIILCMACLPSLAATNTAASCAYSDVTNALALCSNGDTLAIPSGDCVWTNSLSTTKAISIMGAGQSNTIIRDQQTSTSAKLIWISGTHLNFIRVSSFTIEGGTNSYSSIEIGSTTTTNVCRIDHITITNEVKRGIEMDGWSLGVIDNCTFLSHPSIGSPTGIDFHGLGNLNISEYGGATNSNPSWDTIPATWGDTNKCYVENCTFSWAASRVGANGAVDAYNGARFAFRNNYIVNVNVGAHGTDSGGTLRSTHSFECYGNVFSNSIAVIPFSFRGGTGLFYSNAVYQSAGTLQNLIRIDNYRSSGTNIYGTETPCCQPYGPHTATNVYAGKEIVGNGYPSYDQMGRTSPTIYTATNAVQTLTPLYQWSNTFNGVIGLDFTNGSIHTNTGPYAYIPPSSELIVASRDYYDDTMKPGYTPLVYPHPLVTATTPEVYYAPFRKP